MLGECWPLSYTTAPELIYSSEKKPAYSSNDSILKARSERGSNDGGILHSLNQPAGGLYSESARDDHRALQLGNCLKFY